MLQRLVVFNGHSETYYEWPLKQADRSSLVLNADEEESLALWESPLKNGSIMFLESVKD
jgi:hypothetical protein